MDKHLLSDVSDATDFPSSAEAPGLRELDRALRCNICYDFYNGPVTFLCGHCFCSMCARQHTKIEQTCPTCRAQANDAHLRRNVMMEEAVTAWKLARPYISRLSNQQKDSDDLRPAKRRKYSKDSTPNGDASVPSSTGELKRVSASSSAHESPAMTVNLEDSSDDEITDGSLVPCPICQRKMPLKDVDLHIERSCPPVGTPGTKGAPSAKEKWSNIFQPGSSKGKAKLNDFLGDEERLPKVSYSVHKDKKLRQILLEHDLSSEGTRQALINRHERYTMLYNANLDKAPHLQQSKDALRREVQKWENLTRVDKPQAVEDVVAYEKRNQSEFKRLVALARENKQKLKQESS